MKLNVLQVGGKKIFYHVQGLIEINFGTLDLKCHYFFRKKFVDVARQCNPQSRPGMEGDRLNGQGFLLKIGREGKLQIHRKAQSFSVGDHFGVVYGQVPGHARITQRQRESCFQIDAC